MFFRLFSRFEFALKESGYVTTLGASTNAAADWDRFVKDFHRIYSPSQGIADELAYLTTHPPKKQKMEQGAVPRIVWQAMTIDPKAPLLKSTTDIARTVRNNLFHGGKYGEKDWDNPERVKRLLECTIMILAEWPQLHEDLRIYFHDLA